MDLPGAETVIKAKLVADWPHADVPIWFDNERNQLAATPAPFVFVQVQGEGQTLEAIGAGRGANEWMGRGRIEMHVFVPKGRGSSIANTYAETLCAIFRGKRLSDVSYHAGSIYQTGAGGPDRIDKGNYWMVTAEVPFHYRQTA